MGIQINGNTDTISAIDGSLAIQGASGNVTGDLTGNVTGNVNSTGVSTFSGGVVVAAGTTAAPSISPSGDSNTGIFFPSADIVAIGEGGAEALRVDSSGNVGINSTSPARKLDVVDSGASGSVIRSRVTTNNGGYLAYEALNSSGTSVFSVTHNGRINLSDNIVFASGQGIDFSATANSSGTMTSELLDDYERGTWTPTLISRTSPSGSLNYTQNIGYYVKIGNLVFVSAFVSWNSGSLGGTTIQLAGLPFASGPNASRGGLNITYSASGWITGATIYQQSFRNESNETNLIYNFSDATDGKIDSSVNGANISSSGDFMVSGSYTTG